MMRLFEGTEFDIPPRCERCEQLEADCECGPPPPERKAPSEQSAKVHTEKRSRGKVVTIVGGLIEPDTDLPELLSRLKSHCGSGGTLKANTIEIQGDQADRIRKELRSLGYQVK